LAAAAAQVDQPPVSAADMTQPTRCSASDFWAWTLPT
jgi:hypothetical protein